MFFRDVIRLFKKMRGKAESHTSENAGCRQVLNKIALKLPSFEASSFTVPQGADENFHNNCCYYLDGLALKKKQFSSGIKHHLI